MFYKFIKFKFLPLYLKLAFNFQMPNESYLLLPNWYSQMKMVLLTMIPYPISQRLVGRKYQKSLPNLQCSSHSRISSPMLSNGSTRRSVRSDVSTVTSNLSSISYWILFLPAAVVSIGGNPTLKVNFTALEYIPTMLKRPHFVFCKS